MCWCNVNYKNKKKIIKKKQSYNNKVKILIFLDNFEWEGKVEER
jgi:hypothetical protein